MYKIIEYTGGSALLTLGSAFLAMIVVLLSLFNDIKSTLKNKELTKARKIEGIVGIISTIITTFYIGWIAGYFFEMYCML